VSDELGLVDAVVVGGGPSGLSAAMWLARYRLAVTVVDSQEWRSAQVEHSHGYLGRDPQTPTELLERGREELLAYPDARYQVGSVTAIRRCEGGRFDGTFEVDLAGVLSPLRTRALVLATGVVDQLPQVEGFTEHYGASAFHCPACDGYEARDRDVVALGWEPQLAGFAGTLQTWARSVTVVTDGRRYEGDRKVLTEQGVQLIEESASALLGPRGALRAVQLESGREIACDLLFFSVAHTPRCSLAESLGCRLDDDGYVLVDSGGRASTPGVYAAGDLVPGVQLVAVASAKGVVAGVAAAQDLLGLS
jgi:thioredoxin reductase